MTQDTSVYNLGGMQAELSYVREKLNSVGIAQWQVIAHATGVSRKTIGRIAKSESKKAPRSDNVGKVALYFRTKEKRRT